MHITLGYAEFKPLITTVASSQYEYLWADGVRVKHPVKLSAPAYVNTLFDWVEEQVSGRQEKVASCKPPGG